MDEKVTLQIIIDVTEDQACWVGAWMCRNDNLGLPGMSLLEAIQKVFDLGVEHAQKQVEYFIAETPEVEWALNAYLREDSTYRAGWRSHINHQPMRMR